VEIRLSQPAGADAGAFDDVLRVVERQVASVRGVEHVLATLRGDNAWLWLRLERRHAVGERRRQTLADVASELGSSHHVSPYRWQVSDDSLLKLRAAAAENGDVGLLGVEVRCDDPDLVDETVARVQAMAGQKVTRPATSQRVVLEPRLPGVDVVRLLGQSAAERRPIRLIAGGEPLEVEVVTPGEGTPDHPTPLQIWLESTTPRGAVPVQLASHRLVQEPVWSERTDGAFVRRAQVPVARRRMTAEQKMEARTELHGRLRRMALPAGVSLTLEELEPASLKRKWLLPVLIASCCLFVALGVGFESLLAPLRVMAVLIPHLAGAVLVLWLLDVRLNEAAVLGGLLLLGVAVNSGVLLEDRFLGLRRQSTRPGAAAVRAGIERTPTVLLTAATSVLALAPLWFGGVDQLGRPFVAVLGGGMLLGTPAAIVLMPALQGLALVRRRRRSISWRGDGSDVVTLRSLSKRYGQVRALRGVSASLEPGMVGLLGPNGAGKTTLLRIMVGAIGADTGDVWVNGVPRREDPEGWRCLVGYLPQAQAVPLTLEAGQWLEIWAAELGILDPQAAANEALTAMGVVDLAERRLGELSGGQRRRVRVARALLGRPSVLVVDEPTTGLDPEARVELRNLLSEMSLKRLVLLSTHIPEDIAVACRRVLVLAEGRLRLDGTVDELLDQARDRVRQRIVSDEELRGILASRRVVSRVRQLEGIRVRYLCDDPADPGELVEPTLEEAYLWLLGEGSARRTRRLDSSGVFVAIRPSRERGD
jgi:ABC-type multidrug transport system ATPase subunit